MKPLEAVDGAFVMRWPEFKAFTTRLGLSETRMMRKIVVTLEAGSMPQISVESFGIDVTKLNPESTDETTRQRAH